jgi:hypothetical protein
VRGEMRRLLGADSSMVTGGDRAQYVDMFESARISKGVRGLQTLAFCIVYMHVYGSYAMRSLPFQFQTKVGSTACCIRRCWVYLWLVVNR